MAKADKLAPIDRKKAADGLHPGLKRSDSGVQSDKAREERSTEDDQSPLLPSKERIA